MVFRSIEQGISAIQAGNRDEGARLLRIALKDSNLTPTLRAIACLWLAETTDEAQAKRAYYDEALKADPTNAEVRKRVESWVATQMLPPPPETPLGMAPATYTPPQGNPPLGAPAYGPQPQGNTPLGAPAAYNPYTNPPAPPGSTPTNPMPAVQPNPFNVYPANTITPPSPAGTSSRPSAQTPFSQTPGGMYQIIGVIGGVNGPGTGFFVAREGLVATTRYVVGGLENLMVEVEIGRQIPGRVVRAFPEIDLALIYVELSVSDLMPITPLPRIPDDAPFTAVSYNGQVVKGRRRSTKRVLAPHWFPTDVTQAPDAGGCPVLDERHYVIGMLTRNTSPTSSNVYGLHINTIRRYVEQFRQEAMDGPRVYCHACGYVSKAALAGGYYCESCGTLMPQAERVRRYPNPQTSRFYDEHSRISCMYCNATVGFHNGACLRCGRAPSK